MPRSHLFEFVDQSWYPHFLRETSTDFLMSLYIVLDIYGPAYKKIIDTLDDAKIDTIVDCCSGSGGPIKFLRKNLDKKGKNSITIQLTDKFPNISLFKTLEKDYPNKIIGHKESQDARSLPKSLQGMRTFFTAFHHFTPHNAVQILQNAVDNNAPIGIFECTQRHFFDFIRAFFIPIMVPLLLPFSKRLTFKKFVFTYLIPITPFINLWEYIISCVRTYSPEELRMLIKKLNAPDYHWEVGKLWSKKALCYVTYLIGYKRTE